MVCGSFFVLRICLQQRASLRFAGQNMKNFLSILTFIGRFWKFTFAYLAPRSWLFLHFLRTVRKKTGSDHLLSGGRCHNPLGIVNFL